MEVGLVNQIDIDQEMQQAYLDYAMSVIVSRALPDARDGLKPVHRRILYAMYDMGLRPESGYKKSARVVGEVLGKYHPHSDSAVYDAMARMAQEFSMRYPLVDGQGNFGSIDGDPPAAMRYTEARMAAPALDMLADIQRETVDFDANFDDTLTEPTVLPASLPNLLINGATGIAVGMSTSIPPHNLGEVVDALNYMLDNWTKLDDISVEDLMQFVKGPDFPTGGVILQDLKKDDLAAAYGSGRGRLTVQGRAHLEEMGRGRQRVIVTELPYMTNKASLIERIAKLTREGRIEGITDLRDESDRQGMRIVIELSKSADAEEVLHQIYTRTPLRSTFSIILLALVDDEPRLLNLKQALRVYLNHRIEVVRRRSEFELARARQRAHILEGLRVALKNLTEVIELIRKSPDADQAQKRLIKRFELTELQARAILDMPLRRLAALERKKIETEYKELQVEIKRLESLLASPKKLRTAVAEGLLAAKELHGDRRRTQIVGLEEGTTKTAVLTARDIIPDKTVWVSITQDGLLSRSHEDKPPRQSGSKAPGWLLRVNSRDTLYLVSEQGEAVAIAVHALPEAGDLEEGTPYTSLCALRPSDPLAVAFSLPPESSQAKGYYVVTATHSGMVKKSELAELPGPMAGTFQLVKVKGDDHLGWVRFSDGTADVLLAASHGMAIRFSEQDVRPMGLVATGVMGMKLPDGEAIVGMEVVTPQDEAFLLASDGKAKRLKMARFPRQGRYGQGVVGWKLDPGLKLMGMTVGKPNLRVTVHLARLAAKMTRLDAAPLRSRPAGGKLVVEVREDDSITSVTVPWELPSDFLKGSKPSGKSSATGKKAAKAKGSKQGAARAKKSASAESKASGKKS